MAEILASGSSSVRATSGSRSAAAGSPSWQEAMRRAVRDGGQLRRLLQLPADLTAETARGAAQFPVFVPWEYLRRMRVGDPDDPLLRQVLPVAEEAAEVAGFVADPLAEAEATRGPGLLQKYSGRALLVTTSACAVHCRYCFRRHFPYRAIPRGIEAWREALEQLAGDASIDEVLLSGGDPLTLVDDTLAELLRRLAAIGHLRRVRLHTRLPVVIPQRVTDRLIGVLRSTRLVPWVVVHVNHPAELDGPTLAALGRWVDAGIPVLNQAVLLRGVNDDALVLEQLCRTLVDHRVQPYYLHQLDRVTGAAHFEVPPERGRELIAALRTRLPGYAVPSYVSEQPGEAAKRPIGPAEHPQ